jgi:alpha-galactosidase
MINLFAEYKFGDMIVQYWIHNELGFVGLEILPQGWEGKRQHKKQQLDPIVQLMIRGDRFPDGFANGHTMRGSASLSRFRFAGQQQLDECGGVAVITILRSGDGQELRHQLLYRTGASGVEITTEYRNASQNDVTLEMLSSFCIGGLTPFVAADAPCSMTVHRLRSKWSNEARLDSVSVEDLQLEPSWSGYGVASERFGQVGSMPVRRYFPFVAVEDTQNHVSWGVQLACPSSWQMEVYRRDDGLCLSGGLADFEFGHWSKTLKPGESLRTPTAFLSVCASDIDLLCSRLVSMNETALQTMAMPSRLPVVFNEFCTTWGFPSQENIERILASLRGRDIDYFVIDAGWYASDEKGWGANMGDWEISERLFPGGFTATIDAIRAAGFKPGLWFEAEVCGRDAKAFSLTNRLLKRHGVPITVGARRFWDMRDGWVREYLEKRVIGLLKQYGFEYVKIDYNDSIGVGCDGADSLGEGLRQNQIAAREFINHLRQSIPGILVENCSSGGHRLEPSFLGVSQLSSFSDAHEEREIPIIAANLHRAMPPRQSLIWAVMRKNDTPKRLIWSLCATFLGVMCISGDVYDLDDSQWTIVDEAIWFYRAVSPIIQNGTSKRHGPKAASYRHSAGWQAVERTAAHGGDKLIVLHSFEQTETHISIPLDGPYQIIRQFADPQCKACIENNTLTVALTNGACAMFICLPDAAGINEKTGNKI